MSGATERFWERHYAEAPPRAGKPHPVLVQTAGALPPGRGLDLGCSEGVDAIWLALQGWEVVGADVSATALERARTGAAAAGVQHRTRFERHELSRSLPAGRFDLVCAQYLQSPLVFARDAVLRAAADALAPGGLLLIVDHGSARPWAWDPDADVGFPTPQEKHDELGLDPARWRLQRLEAYEREATGPGGQVATVVDTVVAVRRR